jgi:hypothetical protein
MTTFAKKINLSVAAVAMVGAAVLAPSIAQATPSLPLAPSASDDDGGVGGAAGKSPRRAARGAVERNAPAADAGAPSARAGATHSSPSPRCPSRTLFCCSPVQSTVSSKPYCGVPVQYPPR